MREERSREKERGVTAVREKGKKKGLVNLVERDVEREREIKGERERERESGNEKP